MSTGGDVMPPTAEAIGTITITARLPFGTRKQLQDLTPFFASERARAKTLSMASTAGLNQREAAARRSLWHREKQQLRRAGRLTDSIQALVTGAVTQEVIKRGWKRTWPDIPHQAYGRWPGSPEGAWPEALTVDLPADLVQAVRAACWHTCRKEIGLLYGWRERHPDARPRCPTRPGCDAAALAEYQELAAKVITPGEVWRAAVARGIHDASPRDSPARERRRRHRH
ncbi:hypothetical protein SAV31267_099370 [Streptomyces avermitilis]|uniref:Uncharacterized protein n=4 Tax=Streptomyces avermitilis TaxID=33903 RepID=A0A143SZV3_STRAW|nr:hypothetical protein SAVERM_2p042 [Streptomyces avermitilis MA-4680 = NBRC 14893]BBJ56298.1 hypothetical protein SAVMC3_89270 [Streptomyces avermitilis]GDY80452.1 hypothetical protein SAV31267_099370 [Streptomyces avermitilis]